MKNIKLKTSLSILFSVSLLTACQSNISDNSLLTQSKVASVEQVNVNKNLSGMVEFPTEQKLSVKAAPVDPDQLSKVLESSTVSLLYPSNAGALANVTIMTGLTDANGAFMLNFSSGANTFNPLLNSTYTLEAYKRGNSTVRGIAGTDVVSVRTSVKWTGTGWASITTPSLFINSKTTALSLIASYKALPTDSIIGTVTVNTTGSPTSGTNSVPASVTGAPAALTLKVSRMVELVLSNNYDPVRYIQYNSGTDTFSVVQQP